MEGGPPSSNERTVQRYDSWHTKGRVVYRGRVPFADGMSRVTGDVAADAEQPAELRQVETGGAVRFMPAG
jgi:hypothetical protein